MARPRTPFPLLDQYLGARMGVDLAEARPGQVLVVESPRRLRRETSYGYIHALWWVWLTDGRSAVSAPPGAGEAAAEAAGRVQSEQDLLDREFAERLRDAVTEPLVAAGLPPPDRAFQGFSCN